MVQHGPDGRPLFLHANLSPKWSLRVPGDFAAYTRRCARVCMLSSGKRAQRRIGARALRARGFGVLLATHAAQPHSYHAGKYKRDGPQALRA